MSERIYVILRVVIIIFLDNKKMYEVFFAFLVFFWMFRVLFRSVFIRLVNIGFFIFFVDR